MWYFNLNPKLNEIPYWCKAPNNLEPLIDKNVAYSSDRVLNMDISYQLWSAGYIASDEVESIDLDERNLTVRDNYVLLARFVKKQWLWVVCFFRLLELRNPISETMGLINALKIPEVNDKPLKDFIKRQQEIKWSNFESELLLEGLLVSVIIPTLNRYQYLKDVFRDLERQSYENFEVIVVDQTDEFDSKVYEGWSLNLKYWKQEEKALWLARNSAIQTAKGEYILLYDDDSLVEPNWIENHIKCIDLYQADISAGVSISTIGGEVPNHYSYFRWSDQIDTGNVMIKRDVFNKIGLFDRQFEKQRMGDGEFGLRAYLNGFSNISNPNSKRIHLKVSEGGLREMGSWDAWRPKGLFAPRPVPSVLYLSRKYFGLKASIWEIMLNVPSTFVPYRFKGNNKKKILYAPVLVLLFPILFVSVIKSCYLASKKINKGALIGRFETN
jgi:glycosyltransferase involved in cell wall biosynthesis